MAVCHVLLTHWLRRVTLEPGDADTFPAVMSKPYIVYGAINNQVCIAEHVMAAADGQAINQASPPTTLL